MGLINLTPAQLRQAADLKDQIASLEEQLTAIFGGSATPTSIPVAKPVVANKGGMSAAGKARIVAAQKLRWAKIKAGQPAFKPAAVAKPAKKKFTMSAAAKAKISAAAKARWAKIRGTKK